METQLTGQNLDIMAKIIKIKKGLDIPLAGKAAEKITTDTLTEVFAVVPDDFPGYTWKAVVASGDKVNIGSPLLRAKEESGICLVAPLAGTVVEIKRGERRKIEYISVRREGEQLEASRSASLETIELLKESGLYALLRQRPFDIVPISGVIPRDIFVTAFDTAPLAPSMFYGDTYDYLETGIHVLSGLTSGKVYLSIPAGSPIKSDIAEVYEFEGPHPAGNVGTQIAAIKPVNKGETVWTLDAITTARIGRLIKESRLDFTAYVALTGEKIKEPHIVKTIVGASAKTLLKGEIDGDTTHIRVISGNVLSGTRISPENGFLRYPYRQITVISEGDDADEFMGWASMNPGKYSVKRTFPAFLFGKSKPFSFDARIKGGHRAMILSGEYDKVFPFDIYPEYLLKAIMAKDIEKMEKLGIYEVAPEDFALPEFVDTSKLELQKIVREGLNYLRQETL